MEYAEEYISVGSEYEAVGNKYDKLDI